MGTPRNVFESLVRLHETASNAAAIPFAPLHPLQTGFSEVVSHLEIDVRSSGVRISVARLPVRIQTTEGSMARTSSFEAHFLHEKLKYVCLLASSNLRKGGTLLSSGLLHETGKRLEKLAGARERYVERLKRSAWRASAKELSAVAARLLSVAGYLLREGESHAEAASRILADVVAAVGDEKGGAAMKECLAGVQSDCSQLLVRFRANGVPLWGDSPDEELTSFWHEESGRTEEPEDAKNREPLRFSPVDGRMVRPRNVHPKINLGGSEKLKIMSAPSNSNHSCGLTWHGINSSRDECFAVSREASHKIHAALEWLRSRSQFAVLRGDSSTFMWIDGSGEMLPAYGGSILGDSNVPETDPEAFSDERLSAAVDLEFGNAEVRKLKRSLRFAWKNGLLEKGKRLRALTLRATSRSNAAIVDSGVRDMAETTASMCSFDESVAWIVRLSAPSFDENGSPNGRKSIRLFGARRPDWYAVAATPGVSDDNGYRTSLADEIDRARFSGRPFPERVAEILAKRLEMEAPLSGTTDDSEWGDLFRALCGIAAGRKGVTGVSAEKRFDGVEKLSDRSVLMGRLLALYDDMERYMLRMNGKTRATAAEREMRIFRDYPAEAMERIRDRTMPYRMRLSKSAPWMERVYSDMESEILALFWERSGETERSSEPVSLFDPSPLDLGYLLGFHAQRELMRNRAKKHSTDGNAPAEEAKAS